MNVNDLSQTEKEALLDLALLAMYADGHLAQVEDARVHRLLQELGFESKYDRDTQYDAAVTRVSRHSHTLAEARAYTANLAHVFALPEKRRLALETLDTVVQSDNRVAPQESDYLLAVKEAFSG